MLRYLAIFITMIIAGYTVIYGLDILKEKNYGGFCAIIALSLTIVILPVYILFLKS